MNHKWTPGPWEYSEEDSPWDFSTESGSFYFRVTSIPDGKVIMQGVWPAEQRANARLIAAAPELLVALQTIAGITRNDSTNHAELSAILVNIAGITLEKAGLGGVK